MPSSRLALAAIVAFALGESAPVAAEACSCGDVAPEAPLMSQADAEALMSAFFVGGMSGDAVESRAWPLWEPAAEPSVLLEAPAVSLPLDQIASFGPAPTAAPPVPTERPDWCVRADDPRCQSGSPLGAAGQGVAGPLAPPPPSLVVPAPRPSDAPALLGHVLAPASGASGRLERPPRG
ncbi:MAG: hypothetical protein AAGH15_09715 [Myxococcota bacterium]